MPLYTYSTEARISFTLSAENRQEADSHAAEQLRLLAQGMDSSEFLRKINDGHVISKDKQATHEETYDPGDWRAP